MSSEAEKLHMKAISYTCRLQNKSSKTITHYLRPGFTLSNSDLKHTLMVVHINGHMKKLPIQKHQPLHRQELKESNDDKVSI